MKQIAFRYGIWMFLGFTGFFLLMHLFRLTDNYYLRIFNGVIHVGILWVALQAWHRSHPAESTNYSSGVGVGIATSMVGVVPFVCFMAIYLALNPVFMEQVKTWMPTGNYFNPVTASMFILVEGVVMSLISSYIIMRILEGRRERRSEKRAEERY